MNRLITPLVQSYCTDRIIRDNNRGNYLIDEERMVVASTR